MLWDSTLRNITIDTATISDTLSAAVTYESPGATGIVFANITSTGSGTPSQDRAGWSAHVTIQNKVAPRDARALVAALGSTYDKRPIRIAGLGLHSYLGGPWETLRTFPFRG